MSSHPAKEEVSPGQVDSFFSLCSCYRLPEQWVYGEKEFTQLMDKAK
jgi:hypothetical protein